MADKKESILQSSFTNSPEAAAELKQQRQQELYGRWKNERKVLANSLSKLREATFNVASSRERVPHPLFWSVFHCEIKELKRRKEKQRSMAREIFEAE